MPELPEIEALTRALTRDLAGRRIDGLQLRSLAALKTTSPTLDDLVGRRVTEVARRGKLIAVTAVPATAGDRGPSHPGASLHLVVHLGRSGWLRRFGRLPERRPRLGGPVVLQLRFDDGSGLEVTEPSVEKRVSLHVVSRLEDVPGIGGLGVDVLAGGLDRETLTRLLATAGGRLKNVLMNQALIGGIGNAYSDEILHAAHLSPFRAASRLEPDEVERLHRVLVGVMASAVEAAAGSTPERLKRDRRARMAVHGRTGLPCRTCGDTIREVSLATRSFQYCPRCQTGGRVLRDRRLSRLLR